MQRRWPAIGRDPELTIVLTGSDKWATAAVNPLDDIEEWGQAIFDHSDGRWSHYYLRAGQLNLVLAVATRIF